MRIVITQPDGMTWKETLQSVPELQKKYPVARKVSFARTGPTQLQLDDLHINAHLGTEVERPPLEFGQGAVTADVRQPDGTWLQTWTVTTISLPEAKGQLAEMIAGVYRAKVTDPTAQQLLAGGYVGAIQARDNNFKPTLDDIAARVQGAGSVAEAKAIADELGLL